MSLISSHQDEAVPVKPATPTSKLRNLFHRPGLIRVIGAHDALGARLGERAGFDAVWSSGLEVSASHGVPDADILTMSEFLAAAQWIAGAISVPVIADCDTGYGNVNNVAHMVRRYEAAGIAAVCIEDKQFPKLNSLVAGRQDLVPISEFVGKLAAAKNAQTDPDFMVFARVEALVAGMELTEAVSRANHYADAGADAILMHAKDESPQLILDFLAGWNRPTPIVLVPTTYYDISADELAAAGAKMVIYANHGLRASVQAMRETFATIYAAGRTTPVEDRIASLGDVFALQGITELKAHEARYLSAEADVREAVPRQPESKEAAVGEGSGATGPASVR